VTKKTSNDCRLRAGKLNAQNKTTRVAGDSGAPNGYDCVIIPCGRRYIYAVLDIRVVAASPDGNTTLGKV